jgi:hypothetical protein
MPVTSIYALLTMMYTDWHTSRYDAVKTARQITTDRHGYFNCLWFQNKHEIAHKLNLKAAVHEFAVLKDT